MGPIIGSLLFRLWSIISLWDKILIENFRKGINLVFYSWSILRKYYIRFRYVENIARNFFWKYSNFIKISMLKLSCGSFLKLFSRQRKSICKEIDYAVWKSKFSNHLFKSCNFFFEKILTYTRVAILDYSSESSQFSKFIYRRT